jgi:RNA polymerase sigma factor (sigma-70 family)
MATMAKIQDSENNRIFNEELMPHLDAVLTFAYHLCLSEAESQDLAQETYLRAWKNIDTYQIGTNPKAWLMTICRNQFINNYRKKKVRGTQIPYEDFVTTHQKSSDKLHQNAHLKQDIHAKLMGDEITIAVQRLSPENRMVVLLKDIDDFSYEEIAAIADIPLGTVRSRLHRARKMMKVSLRAYAEKMGYDTSEDLPPGASDELD